MQKIYPPLSKGNRNKYMIVMMLLNLFFVIQSKSATYYVDGKRGNDNQSGLSKEKAWKTLNKVNEVVLMPGDSVLFRSSTIYSGHLKISCRGKSGNKIVFSSFGKGERPKIEANGLFSEAVLIFNSEFLKFENFEITNQGEHPKAKRIGLQITLDNFGISYNTEIMNLYVHDVNGSNRKSEGGGSGIHWSNGGMKLKSAFDGLLIENCQIERTDRNGITSSGYWTRTEWFPSRNVVIRNNRLSDIGGDGIVPIGCDGALIEHNYVCRAGQRFPEGDAAAGIWPWSCDNTIIQFNEVSFTDGPWDSQGFDSDWNCRNTIIQYNYSHNNVGGFLLVCNDGSSKLPANIGNRATIVRYNVSVNDGYRTVGKSAGFSPVIHIAGPVNNTKIYNNVIYRDKKSPNIDSTLIEMGNWNGYADSTLIANNIFYVETTVDYKLAKSTRNYYQSNIYYGNHVNIPESGNKKTDDPKFVSLPIKVLSGFDQLKCFKLLDSSVGQKAGVPVVTSVIKDFFGNDVMPGRNPSIGIFESAP
ncbi:right-handed parallel beta-helix repeat-containing protein [Pedobacter sp. UYEF25]